MKKLLILFAFCTVAMTGYSQQLDLGTYTDHSDTTTGTSQTVMAAARGNGRVGWFLQNLSGDGTVMYVNFRSAASANGESFKLVDGASASSQNFCTTDSIMIYCASSGKKFCAKEFIGK